jgi:crotonobetainyl-CoA:carnitine CoA-transferase CaiB-like acyl-CoA transferase
VKSLDGIRVLDLSRVLAGPWATQLLADFGAYVIKVERPGTGDDTRQWGPPFLDDTPQSPSAYFLSANRGKRSIAIDFTTPDGNRIVRALAGQSDVVIENFKPGGLAAHGLDYAALSAANPRLIYCSITGYGPDGPLAAWPGYDFVLQGVSGLMSITGAPDGAPAKVGVAVVDIMTGLYASNAVLAALHQRGRTGLGQHIDIALLDVGIAALANQALNYLVSGQSPERLGNVHPSIMPYQSFETADRQINIAVGNDTQFAVLCALLDMSTLSSDERFKTNASRVRHRDALAPLLQAEFGKYACDRLVRRLNDAGIPAGPVNSVKDVFEDPQVRHRKIARAITHPVLGTVPGVACPVRFSGSAIACDLPPPQLGEHTVEILRDYLAMTDDDIAALGRDGTI